jgi:hypothetical protein
MAQTGKTVDDIINDLNVIVLPNGQEWKRKVKVLNFASKKFIPQSREDRHKAFDTGSNHHVAVFQYEEGDDRRTLGVICTMVEAKRRAVNKEAVVRRILTQEDLKEWGLKKDQKIATAQWKFMYSLCKGDMVELDNGEVYRVEQFSDGNIYFVYNVVGCDYGHHNGYRLRYKKRQGAKKIDEMTFKFSFSQFSRIKRKLRVPILGAKQSAIDALSSDWS